MIIFIYLIHFRWQANSQPNLLTGTKPFHPLLYVMHYSFVAALLQSRCLLKVVVWWWYLLQCYWGFSCAWNDGGDDGDGDGGDDGGDCSMWYCCHQRWRASWMMSGGHIRPSIRHIIITISLEVSYFLYYQSIFEIHLHMRLLRAPRSLNSDSGMPPPRWRCCGFAATKQSSGLNMYLLKK